MKKISIFTTLLSIAVSLVSCSKDELDTTVDVSTTYEPDEFMAMSEMNREASDLPCNNQLREVHFKISASHNKWNDHIMLRYFGAHPDDVDDIYVNWTPNTRPYLKSDKEAKDTNVPFVGGHPYVYATAYIASYKGSNGNAHYHFCLVDTSRTDNKGNYIRVGKQYPKWGSCSGDIFEKDITGLLDLMP